MAAEHASDHTVGAVHAPDHRVPAEAEHALDNPVDEVPVHAVQAEEQVRGEVTEQVETEAVEAEDDAMINAVEVVDAEEVNENEVDMKSEQDESYEENATTVYAISKL